MKPVSPRDSVCCDVEHGAVERLVRPVQLRAELYEHDDRVHGPLLRRDEERGRAFPVRMVAVAASLRQQFPFLLEGTDFYDGTHVVCNHTGLAGAF